MTHSDQRSYFFKIDTTIKKIRNYMQKGLNEAGIELTVDQWVVLDHIKPKQGISQNDLALETAKDAPTITRILDLLINKGLIVKQLSENDRRRTHLFLSPKGNEIHQNALLVIGEIRKKSWNNLDNEDYESLVRIMDTIYKNVSTDKLL
jgi:DNA-binding MarR family transcriptional regulator